jgi:hypothetical protein
MDDDARWSSLLRPRSTEAFVGSLAVLFLLALAGIMPAQNDTWWNLAAGRQIVSSRAVDLVDHFSWIARGHYWSNHEWLAQVLFYGAHSAGGMPMLTAVAMGFVWATVLLVWRLMAGPPLLRALLLFLSCSLFVSEFSVRPKVVTLAAVALTASLLVSRRYAWLPVLFAAWANLHGAVALGIVMLGAACAEALVHDRSKLPRLLLASVLAAAATALTPLGFSLVEDVVLSLRRPDYAYVTEWQPAGVEPWTWTLFVLIAALAALTWRFRRALDERERALLYLAGALLPLALRYSRNIPPFTIVALPLLSSLVLRVNGTASLLRSSRPRARPLIVPLAIAAAVASMAVAYAWATRLPRLEWDPLPPAAARAIAACRAPIYNHFDNGGPIIWFVPSQPVFIDSRQHPYPAAFIVRHFEVEESGDYKPLFGQYGIRCAVLPPQSRVSQALLRDGWNEIYADSTWLVLAP